MERGLDRRAHLELGGALHTGTHNMKFGYQGAFHVDNRAPGGVDR